MKHALKLTLLSLVSLSLSAVTGAAGGYSLTFALLCLVGQVGAQTPEPSVADQIHLPALPMPPAPLPGSTTKLPADTLYVITSMTPFFVLASPEGFVSITNETGPLRIRAKYVEAPDKITTRTFTDKYIVVVEAAKTGLCELLVFPANVAKSSDVIRRMIDASTAPQPPPAPPTPAPSDPLWPALSAAYAADPSPTKADAAGKLASIYRVASTATVNDATLTTLGGLFHVVSTGAQSLVPLPALQGVRQVVGAELQAKLGTDAAVPLGPAVRASAGVQFARMANLLDALSR